MYPTVAAAVVPIYNLGSHLPNNNSLILSREVLVEIFAGNITKWNDPQIQHMNLDFAHQLPSTNIDVVVRQVCKRSGNK